MVSPDASSNPSISMRNCSAPSPSTRRFATKEPAINELPITRPLEIMSQGSAPKLRKTSAFLEAHPFGTVPAAFSPDGKVGVFESNSIMRAVARLGASRFPLYGQGPYEASRVDSFLDASLVFARDAQIYLLALMSGKVSAESYARARDGFVAYAGGIDQALSSERRFLVGEDVTLADICFVAEMSLFCNERGSAAALEQQGLTPILHPELEGEFPRAMGHLARLRKHPAFAPDVDPYLAKLGVP